MAILNMGFKYYVYGRLCWLTGLDACVELDILSSTKLNAVLLKVIIIRVDCSMDVMTDDFLPVT